MITVIDTNFLTRYFNANKDIGNESKNIFENENTFLIIPSIVLVELKYGIAKQRFSQYSLESANRLVKQGNCMVYPLDETLLDYIPIELDIHDGIIFATAAVQRKNFNETIYLLSKDSKIKNLNQDLVKVVW